MKNRRKFLVGCSAAAVAATVAPAIVLAERILPRAISLDRLSFASFASVLHTPFEVYADSTDLVEMELIEAKPWRPSNRKALSTEDAHNEKFSLLFIGSTDRLLPQRMYLFDHDVLGSFVMFIVPILSTDPGHYYYEAVFNRPGARTKRIGLSPISTPERMLRSPPEK